MDDKIILDLLNERDSKGLELAIAKYGGLVRTIIYNMVYDKMDTEELVTDTFLKLWRNSEAVDIKKGGIKSYLCVSAKCLAIDRLRQKKRFDDLSIEENDIGFDVDFEDEVAKNHNSKVISDCINNLPYPQNQIFIHRYYFKVSIKEIAEKFDISPKKVENILYRSKKKLKEALIKGGIIL